MKVLMDSYGFRSQIKHFLQDIYNSVIEVSVHNNKTDIRRAWEFVIVVVCGNYYFLIVNEPQRLLTVSKSSRQLSFILLQ